MIMSNDVGDKLSNPEIYKECNYTITNEKSRKDYAKNFHDIIQSRFLKTELNRNLLEWWLDGYTMLFGLDKILRTSSQDIETLEYVSYLLFKINRSFQGIVLNEEEFLLLCKFSQLMRNLDATNMNSFYEAFESCFSQNEIFAVVNPRVYEETFFVKNFNERLLLAMLYFKKFPVILQYSCDVMTLTGNPDAVDAFYDRNIYFPDEYPSEREVEQGYPGVRGENGCFAFLPDDYLEPEEMPRLREDVSDFKIY